MCRYVTAFSKRWLRRKLICLECREENRPFSGQQHQAQFGLNPALRICFYKVQNWGEGMKISTVGSLGGKVFNNLKLFNEVHASRKHLVQTFAFKCTFKTWIGSPWIGYTRPSPGLHELSSIGSSGLGS